jgi:hypothetical protein
MKLLPGSPRATYPLRAPIQPKLLEFSREFDTLPIRYVGKLNDSGLMPEVQRFLIAVALPMVLRELAGRGLT